MQTLSKEFIINNYPKTWAVFYEYFSSEGWGCDNADNLSESGFNTWFTGFLSEYAIMDIAEFENSL